MDTRRAAILSVLSSVSLACSAHAVDLDATMPFSVTPSDEPDVLGVVHERVRKIVVDDQRLYWSGTQIRPHDTTVWNLRSCEKRNCTATLVTYDAHPAFAESNFTVISDQIYWHAWNSAQVLACPIMGCEGAPRVVADNFSSQFTAFDDNNLFFSRDLLSIYRLPLREGGLLQQVAVAPSSMFPSLAVRGDYAYWLASTDSSNEGSLMRARKDGSSSAVETISTDARYSVNRPLDIAADATSVYWTNNLLAGSIQRCPLTGCGGAPEVVLAPIRSPMALLIDGSELYYIHETEPYQYALSSCSLPTCEPSNPLIEHLSANLVAVDDEYVYTASTDQDTNPLSNNGDFFGKIRRIPKPDRSAP